MRVATIVAGDMEGVRGEARSASPYADLLELRLDLLSSRCLADLPSIVRGMTLPVISTCRRRLDGGGFDGAEEERIALLRRAREAGAAWIDVEAGSAAAALAAEVPGCILSHHDREETPASVQKAAADLRRQAGARMAKLVTRARSLQDSLRIREVLSEPGPIPLIAFCTGEEGQPSRLLARSWGSAATYGSAGEAPAAPGQLPVAVMERVYREGTHGPRTRLAGITGWPLAGSLSPAVHNAAYEELGLDWLYLPLPCRDPEDSLAFARSLGFVGLSVTRPHKIAVREHLSSLDAVATRVGAVNTVVIDGTQARGENTDVEGGVSPLRRRLALAATRVAIVGAGGAARALAHGLRQEGARVSVFARRPQIARALAAEVGGEGAPISALEHHRWDVLVNATPVGGSGSDDGSPVPMEWLRGAWVYDIVYHARGTRLLRDARERGLGVIDGVEMFLAQGAEQFQRFTGVQPPTAVMERAARSALEGEGDR